MEQSGAVTTFCESETSHRTKNRNPNLRRTYCLSRILEASGAIWNHLWQSGTIWGNAGPSGTTWYHLGPSGTLWEGGAIWGHLVPSSSCGRAIWCHLELFGTASEAIWGYLEKPWQHTKPTARAGKTPSPDNKSMLPSGDIWNHLEPSRDISAIWDNQAETTANLRPTQWTKNTDPIL